MSSPWPIAFSMIGASGATGNTGAQGDTGAQGIQGDTGGVGVSVYNGLEIPSDTGAQGDYFINNNTRDIYTYSTNTWNNLFSPEAYFSSVRTNGIILSGTTPPFQSTFTTSTVSTFTSTFMYTGDVANFTIPQGTSQITFQVLGAGGANAGGGGAYVSGTYAVQSGDSPLGIYVGQGGQFAAMASGATYALSGLTLATSGGSAPDVSLSDPLNAIVLGGGGGAASGIMFPNGTDAIVAAGGAGGFFDGTRVYPGGAGGIGSGSEPVASLPILVTSLDLASDVVDRGTNPQTVTVNGTVPFSTIQGIQCAYFDNNIENYLSLPFTPVSGTQGTISYWFNAIDTNAYDVLTLGSAATGGFGMNMDTSGGSTLSFAGHPTANGNMIIFPSSYVGKWTHIAMSFDLNGITRLFLNGVLDNSIITFNTWNNGQYMILGKAMDNGRAYNGYTAKVGVYNKALGAAAIMEIYNSQGPLLIAPSSLASSAISSTGFTVSWSQTGPVPTGYTYKIDGSLVTPSTDNGLSARNAVFTDLIPSTTYSVEVIAAGFNQTRPSTALSVQTSAPAAPTAITGLASSNVTYNGITVSWSGGTGYGVTNTFTLNGTAATPSSSGTGTATFTGLTAETEYTIVVTATNTGGSVNSSVSATTLVTPPEEISLVLLKAVNYSGSGIWQDESGNGKNATFERGTIAKNTEGNGIILDGSTSWTFPNVAIGNAWTANVWYKNTGGVTTTDAMILTQIANPDVTNLTLGYNYVQNNGTFFASFNTYWPSGSWNNGNAFNLGNVWTNIQATWDGTNLTTYIDGSLLGTTQPGGISTDGGTNYRIGGTCLWFTAGFIIGEIGEVRMYGYPRTQAQVTADYNASLSTFTGGGGGGPSPPTAITGLASSSITSSALTVSWSGGSGTGVTTTYTLNGSAATPSSSGAGTASFSGLTASTEYTVQVIATNTAGSVNSSLVVTTSAGGGGGGASGVPTTISGLQVWLDGTDPLGTGSAPSDASTVSTWSDKSGNSRSFTGSGTYNATTNGIALDGSTSNLFKFSQMPIGYTGTVAMVLNINHPGGSWDMLIQLGQYAQGISLRINGFNGINTQINTDGTDNKCILPLNNNLIAIFYFTFTGSETATIFAEELSGSVLTAVDDTYVSTIVPGNQNISIGSYDGVTGGLTAQIHELVYYDTVLGTSDKQTLLDYLALKWSGGGGGGGGGAPEPASIVLAVTQPGEPPWPTGAGIALTATVADTNGAPLAGQAVSVTGDDTSVYNLNENGSTDNLDGTYTINVGAPGAGTVIYTANIGTLLSNTVSLEYYDNSGDGTGGN